MVLYGSDNLSTLKGQKYDAVFLGNSRCYNQLDPKVFRDSLGISSINLGIEGHLDILMHELRLKHYIANNPAPKVAILCFDPMMNAGTFNPQKDFTHKDFFSRYAFFPNREDEMIVNYFGFNLFEKYVPLYALLKYNIFIKCISPAKKTIMETRGVAIFPSTLDTTKFPMAEAGQTKMRSYNTFRIFYDSIKVSLLDLDNLCKSNNIKLICVQMPMYRSIYKKDAFDMVTKMCDECGITVIDVNDDFDNGDQQNFADPAHLNYNGVPKAMNVIIKNKKFLEAVKR